MSLNSIRLFLFIFIFFLLNKAECFGDTYLIYYATINGKVGHIGIAIDNYELREKENYTINGKLSIKKDSIKTGDLTYFDLWPEKDEMSMNILNKSVPAKYYRLPSSSSEKKITIGSLMIKGVPHKEGYPCDGIIRLVTTPSEDFRVYAFIDTIMDTKKMFSTRDNNCADFGKHIVEFLKNIDIYAKEFIPFQYSTTPNSLFREVAKINNTEIIKDPGAKKNGSFWIEAILKANRN